MSDEIKCGVCGEELDIDSGDYAVCDACGKVVEG